MSGSSDNSWSHWPTSAKSVRASKTNWVPASLWGSGGKIERRQSPKAVPLEGKGQEGNAGELQHLVLFAGDEQPPDEYSDKQNPAPSFTLGSQIQIWSEKTHNNQSASGRICLARIPCRKLQPRHSRHRHLQCGLFLLLVGNSGGRAGIDLPVLALLFAMATQLNHSRINSQII